MKRIISIFVVFCFVFGTIPLLAQQTGTEQTGTSENPNVEIIKSEDTSPVSIASAFSKSGKTDQELTALDSQLKKEGFTPQVAAMSKDNKPNYWGHIDVYRNNQTNEEGSVSISMQNYSKSNSKDSAAAVQIRFSVGDRSQVYSCSLIARNGDFENMEEYKVENNLSVTKANSWWTCVKKYIRNHCPKPCLGSLIVCGPVTSTVVGYVACVAIPCGACATRSIACCTCDCSWWCKWASGCCNR